MFIIIKKHKNQCSSYNIQATKLVPCKVYVQYRTFRYFILRNMTEVPDLVPSHIAVAYPGGGGGGAQGARAPPLGSEAYN